MAQSLNSDSGLSTSHLISPTLPRPSVVVEATLALLFLMHLLDNRGRLCFLRFEDDPGSEKWHPSVDHSVADARVH